MLTAAESLSQQVAEHTGRSLRTAFAAVVVVCTRNRSEFAVTEIVIDTAKSKVVVGRHLGDRGKQNSSIRPPARFRNNAVSFVGYGIQIQVRLGGRTHRDWSNTRKDSVSRVHVGNASLRIDALRLPQAFVTRKKECSVFYDGAAERTAKLISFERRLAAALVLFPLGGIQCIVAKKLKQRSVEVIRSRFGDGADNCTGLTAVFRRVVVGDDLEFLDRFRAGELPGCGLGVTR